jgi:hypothetical protein
MGKNIFSTAVRQEADIRSGTRFSKSAKIRKRGKQCVTLFCVGLISSMLLGAAQAQIKYRVTELRTGRSPGTFPEAINNNGDVIGT